MNEFAARRAQAWIRGPREQDYDRVSAGGGDMGGAGIVSYSQRGRAYQSGQRRYVGASDKVHGVAANIADHATEIRFAMDTHQDRLVTGPFQFYRQLAVPTSRPTLRQVARRRARNQHGKALADKGNR